MGLILDTSAVIALTERHHPGVRAVIIAEAATAPSVSTTTMGELLHGVEASPDSLTRARRQSTFDACDRFSVIDVDQAVARHYGLISAAVGKSRANDRWIAATASATGLTLVTLDAELARLLAVRSIPHLHLTA